MQCFLAAVAEEEEHAVGLGSAPRSPPASVLPSWASEESQRETLIYHLHFKICPVIFVFIRF